MWINHILFIRSSVDEHLECSHVGAVVNNAIGNICEQIFVWTCVFISLGDTHTHKHTYIPRSGTVELLSHIIIMYLTFWGTANSSKQLHHFTFPSAMYEFQFLYIHINTCQTIIFLTTCLSKNYFTFLPSLYTHKLKQKQAL